MLLVLLTNWKNNVKGRNIGAREQKFENPVLEMVLLYAWNKEFCTICDWYVTRVKILWYEDM